MDFVHSIAETLDKGEQTDVIYLDMAKAFDKIPHEKLIHKLEMYGIRNPLLNWFPDYLTGRRHRVLVEDVGSEWKEVYSGVPQGSILGPTLFIIYINDISQDLSEQTRLPLYADDAKCYRNIKTVADQHILQNDLVVLTDWCTKWGMEFNNDKCKLLTITRKRNFNSFTYNLGNDYVPMSEMEKDLGVIMHHKLMWRDHIFSKVNTANKILRLIKRTVRGISNKDVLKKLYIHMVRPHLEYACEVWSPHQEYLKDLIEAVQPRATRQMIKNKSYMDRLNELKLLTLASQRKLLDLTFFFKCLHDQCDLNVLNYVDEVKSPYNLRNSELSYKPRFARTNVLKFSYFHRTAVAWNALPLFIRQSNSIELFKSRVFCHLFETEQCNIK